ncbi:hypothetical protein [Capnocytophaga catalasegens]|uniref:Uncharacterized protein n=1 Tax=Capnocytophaga catalasegens TaxID=1004260 RepID=A0AAV5ARS4_9FLAO|nr:hypothetical protein [Capnocytophaga catalasegens]GIZ15828.1 hypothetical protein RCZ03_18280 [Capnocytophaga catalasegens]GJM49194.1 hypothetical protein RCZ15_01700 [Capnocytophaga catalasegens]GJM53162.1 hypothetical protein RCZ16_14790 [Capnocytophaga catalasegens]
MYFIATSFGVHCLYKAIKNRFICHYNVNDFLDERNYIEKKTKYSYEEFTEVSGKAGRIKRKHDIWQPTEHFNLEYYFEKNYIV